MEADAHLERLLRALVMTGERALYANSTLNSSARAL
jgi:hypothetical protein